MGRTIARGDFSAGRLLSPNVRAWTDEEIDAYVESRPVAPKSEFKALASATTPVIHQEPLVRGPIGRNTPLTDAERRRCTLGPESPPTPRRAKRAQKAFDQGYAEGRHDGHVDAIREYLPDKD
jgi:hypothetical protein